MGIHKYTIGINEYTDWTVDEYRQRMLGLRVNATQMRKGSLTTFRKLPIEVKTPKSVDWREKKVVTPVKDQGTMWLMLVVFNSKFIRKYLPAYLLVHLFVAMYSFIYRLAHWKVLMLVLQIN